MIEEWTDKNGDVYRWNAESNRYLLQKKEKAPAKKKPAAKKTVKKTAKKELAH